MRCFSLFRASLVIFLSISIYTARGLAHDPVPPTEIERLKQIGELDERVARIDRLRQFQMSAGLQKKSVYKLKKAALQAAGFSPNAIGHALYSEPQMSFPFAAQPELISHGTIKTLTILVDFKDYRADTVLPGLTPSKVSTNIYGAGTADAQAYKPYESVHAYYHRASEHRVDLQGDVLGWYHFPNERHTYEPAHGHTSEEQAFLDNQAIFNMVKESLTAITAANPGTLAQYDNDNDGDIDLLTVVYAGPNTGWGNFWWAYRWEFFVNDAHTIKFGGKTVHQFVFEFANQRANGDFDPTTLMHEMGHAFGLADYYHYYGHNGPPGGVGGLDMMDANMGNHCAFSRWLLDWIEPEIIGSGSPTVKTLVASGSEHSGTKAIAIFPQLGNVGAPSQELFMIENRCRFGNDAGTAHTPGEGLLVWHALARPNADSSDFDMNNSDTPLKLLRLVRAGKAADFMDGEAAQANDYFVNGNSFGPGSIPSSHRYDGAPTNITVRDISATGEFMTVNIGFAAPGSASSSPVPAGASPAITSIEALSRRITSGLQQADAEAIDLNQLEEVDRDLSRATPDEVKYVWNQLLGQGRTPSNSLQASLISELLLTKWAAKDGLGAVKTVQSLPDGELKKRSYPRVMLAWAQNKPLESASWYFAQGQTELRNSKELVAGAAFNAHLFKAMVLANRKNIDESLDKLASVRDIWGAIEGIHQAQSLLGNKNPDEAVHGYLNKVHVNATMVNAIHDAQEALRTIDKNVPDAPSRTQLHQMIIERFDR